MALINCPECGNSISDKANSCPKCGFPIQSIQNTEYDKWVTISAHNAMILKYNRLKGNLIIEQYGRKIIEDSFGAYQISGDVKDFKPILLISHKSLSSPTVVDRSENTKELEWMLDYKEEATPVVVEPPKFDGVYRYTLGSKQEVYCPRCNSSNCSHYKEQKVIPGKTKTKYTANLNPLKPFTLVNKKEKVIKQERVITENKFICNSCGKIFT